MPRRFRLYAVVGALMIAAGSAAMASASTDRHSELCGRYQTTQVKNHRYVVMNNVWGATTPQCLDVAADGSFRVIRTGHHSVDTAAAFPSIYAGCHWGNCTRGTNLPLRVDEIKSARSSWRTATGAAGVWNATYDIWFHTSADINRSPDGAELMIWLDRAGGANPGGKIVARNVRLAGATWDVWYEDSVWNYVAYVRTKPVSSTRNLDLKAFTADAVNRGYVKPAWYLSGIEAGFEVWRDGAGLSSRSFSVAVAKGVAAAEGQTSATASGLPGSIGSGVPPTAGAGCTVRWSSNSWSSGMVANVSVVNHGPPLSSWWVEWTFLADERVDTGWGAELNQTGRRVVAGNAPYNGALATGASADFGFQARHGGEPRQPEGFRLNGVRCVLE